MDNNNDVDMFTNFANSLLLVIIGLLPFREAARSSVLSARWRDLWKETTNIEFNENFFVNHDETEENQRAQRGAFLNFANRFIANYPQMAIQKLSVTCSKPQEFLSDMQKFVFFGTSRNVRELSLDFAHPTWREKPIGDNRATAFRLPLDVYQNGGLESLKLFSCSFDVLNFTHFNVLRSLSLGWMQLSMNTIRSLLVCCPQLESLSLNKCWNMENFEITLPNLRLKDLVLDECEFAQDWFYFEGPKFRSFKYSGNVGQFYLENQRFMVEAELDFGMETEFGETGTLLSDLLQGLYAVQILTVCSVFLQLIPNEEEPIKLRVPLNVRQLILKTALHSNEFCGIKFMLNSCPDLEKLIIDLGPGTIFSDYYPPYDFNPRDFWSKNLIVEPCIKRTLRIVDVKGFKGTWTELHVLIYIIHFGRVMQELNLYLAAEEGGNGNGGKETYMQRARLVMQCPKASPNLRISIFY